MSHLVYSLRNYVPAMYSHKRRRFVVLQHIQRASVGLVQ